MNAADPIPRMSADDRREQVLAAATRAFARTGYAGTSTDVVAREAGVSQPYVVRMFGTKRDLFLEVFDARPPGGSGRRSQAVLDERRRSTPTDEDDWGRLGAAYTELLADRDFLLVMMHGFAAGDDDGDRGAARAAWAGSSTSSAAPAAPTSGDRDFVAHGMLLNVMLSMRAPEHATRTPAGGPDRVRVRRGRPGGGCEGRPPPVARRLRARPAPCFPWRTGTPHGKFTVGGAGFSASPGKPTAAQPRTRPARPRPRATSTPPRTATRAARTAR